MIDYTTRDNVATITLGGEGKFNPGSLAQFDAALDKVVADESVGVLCVTGTETCFSQGLDLEYLMSQPETAMQFVEGCMRSVGRLLSFPVPVVSLVNGHAFGLGAMIVLASDYAVMREDRGYFCLPEADLGMSLTYRMNALVSSKLSGAVLRDVLLTARRVTGPEAQSLGIVDAAVAVDQLQLKGLELAEPMIGKPRQVLSGLKRGINLAVLQVIEAEEPDQTI